MDASSDGLFDKAALIPNHDGPQLEFATVAVAEIEPKLGSVLMKTLMPQVPMGDLDHLKRIHKDDKTNKLRIILAAVPADEPAPETSGFEVDASSPGVDEAALLSKLPSPALNLITQHQLKPFLYQVPRFAPYTRDQWAEWCRIWPISWRPPEPHLLTTKYNIGDELQAYFERHMESALSLSSSSSCPNACVIVDPATDKVIAQAADETSVHPLRHAAIAAVDLVAQRDLLLWPKRDRCKSTASQNGLADGTNPEEGHEAKKRKVEEAEGQPGSSGTAVEAGERERETEGGGEGTISVQDPGPKPYLCTGWDAFLVREPCTMCAMALTHSRLGRVVFCERDEEGGALHGPERLQGKRSLNHHFSVFHLQRKGAASLGGGER